MVVRAADAAASEQIKRWEDSADLALAQRKREARARLDAREAEVAVARLLSSRKRLGAASKRSCKRLRCDAATHIQAAWRGFRGRDKARQMRGLSVHAALCIQVMRTRLASVKQRNTAATRIQDMVRGFYSRRCSEARLLAPPSPATAPCIDHVYRLISQ